MIALEEMTSALQNAFLDMDNAGGIALFGGDGAGGTGTQNLANVRAALMAAPVAFKDARVALEEQAINREDATALTPLTVLYEDDSDHSVDDVPDMRSYRLEDFKGDREKCTKDSYACIDWLTRAVKLGDNKHWSHKCLTDVIQLHATHEAGRTVKNALADNKTLTELIIDLETNYSGLVHPDLALEHCKNMSRKEGEAIRGFGERIRLMAEMACRTRGTPELKISAALELARDSFFTAIRPSLKNELRAKLDVQRRLGEREPTFTEIVSEAHKMDETRAASEKIFRGRKGNSSGTVRRVTRDTDDENSSDTDDKTQDTDEDEEGGLQEALRVVSRFNDKRKRGNFRGGNRKFQPRGQTGPGKTPEYKGRALTANQFEEYDDDGEFLTLHYVKTADRGGRRLRVSDLNVLPHECARCGIAGHRTVGPDANKCPLRMYITQPEPCRACNKGGHEAKVCPRTPHMEKN